MLVCKWLPRRFGRHRYLGQVGDRGIERRQICLLGSRTISLSSVPDRLCDSFPADLCGLIVFGPCASSMVFLAATPVFVTLFFGTRNGCIAAVLCLACHLVLAAATLFSQLFEVTPSLFRENDLVCNLFVASGNFAAAASAAITPTHVDPPDSAQALKRPGRPGPAVRKSWRVVGARRSLSSARLSVTARIAELCNSGSSVRARGRSVRSAVRAAPLSVFGFEF